MTNMKCSLQTFLLVLTLIAIFGVLGHRAFQTKPLPYRQYLKSIEGSDAWFRVGSYSLANKNSTTEFDLYYSDSDRRPDGPQDSWPYPNSFGLYCVWQLPDGSWRHKELVDAARTTFHKVTSVTSDQIELQLRANFRIRLPKNDEDSFEKMMKVHDANQPYSCKLMFENGVPALKGLSGKSLQPKPPGAG